jgi:hypothetical protein
MGGKRKAGNYNDLGDIVVNMDYYNSKIDTQPDANGCLNWFGATHRQGYGMMGGIRKADNKRIMTVTHRVTARLKYGRPLTHDDFVIHSCSNVRCQNPEHLFLGNYSDKAQNMIRNGRSPVHRGTGNTGLKKQNRTYKYSVEDIQWIRNASTEEIMARYRVIQSRAATMRWSMRKGYKWIPLEDTGNE